MKTKLCYLVRLIYWYRSSVNDIEVSMSCDSLQRVDRINFLVCFLTVALPGSLILTLYSIKVVQSTGIPSKLKHD